MSAARKELRMALCCYTTDTLFCIDTVRGFCERSSKWMLRRETELHMLMDIKDRDEQKAKGVSGFMKSTVGADTKCAELQEELAAVLKDTLGGLYELHSFLDAVEKLSVTSLHVFKEENQVLHLPQGISPEHVQLIITAARHICPLLLKFKRDASVFFLPRLQNVQVLSYQLDKYIQTTQTICEKMEKSCLSDFCPKKTVVDLDEDFSEDDIQRMLCHINQLDEIRKNQHFRMVFLFQEVKCSRFISEFNERQPRMLQFLQELEERAVQLDRMNKGAKISSVAGSSVGLTGGILSIVGLALIPVTAGVSLGLTMTGVAMGVTSGVNSLVTTATEIGVNSTQQNKANEILQSFMEDVQSLQVCLEVTNREMSKVEQSKVEVAVAVGKVLSKAGTIGKGIDSLVDTASAVKMLKSEQLIASAGKVVAQEGKALRNVPRVASEIPDMGQAAVKGSLALSKTARAGLIAVNALFIGLDAFFICKDSISLAKGSETEASQFIRARAALLSSEMDSWQKIHDSLKEGLLTSEKNKVIMESPFFPEMEVKKQRP